MIELVREGRDQPEGARLVTAYESIGASDFAKAGCFRTGQQSTVPFPAESPYRDCNTLGHGTSIDISYAYRTPDGTVIPVRHRVPVDATDCPVRGLRFWFLCPACSRRTESLYFGEERLACRRCARLTYSSQHSGRRDRTLRKALVLHAALLGTSLHELLCDLPDQRPPGMSRQRYKKMRDELDDLLALI